MFGIPVDFILFVVAVALLIVAFVDAVIRAKSTLEVIFVFASYALLVAVVIWLVD